MLSSIANRVLRTLNPSARLKQEREIANSVPEATAEENDVLAIAARYSMSGKPRLWSLLQSMRHVAHSGIDGDIVECGVWKGGNLVLCGLMAKKLGIEKHIWGYDTFEGMSAPTDADVRIGTTRTVHDRWQANQRGGINDWCYSPYEEVEQNFRREVGTGNLTLVKGKVEDTLDRSENIPGKIAILRLDTDWYESTKKELDVLYPRLQKGGILIIDDYGHWAGAKKAVDEYFAEQPIWLHRVDYTGRLAIKS
jgi:hypothetical protein